MNEALKAYRQMVYLQDLTDPEFVVFADDVTGTLEEAFPVYTTFIEMPAVNDTVEFYVITTMSTSSMPMRTTCVTSTPTSIL